MAVEQKRIGGTIGGARSSRQTKRLTMPGGVADTIMAYAARRRFFHSKNFIVAK